MKRTHVLASTLLLATVGFAQTSQQSPYTGNTQDRTYSNSQTYHTGDTGYTGYNTGGHGWGNWGLLGLLGLAGLFGRRRGATTTTYTRDDRTYGEQQRRVG